MTKTLYREIRELRESIADLQEDVDLLKQTADVFPECTSLKATARTIDLCGLLEGELLYPEDFRQRIVNE